MSGPTVKRDDAVRLFQLLRGKRFVKAKDIPMQSRKVRAICTAYPDQFLSTQQGYCLVIEATPAEIQNAIADLRSRCQHMTRRADSLESTLCKLMNRQLI